LFGTPGGCFILVPIKTQNEYGIRPGMGRYSGKNIRNEEENQWDYFFVLISRLFFARPTSITRPTRTVATPPMLRTMPIPGNDGAAE
jgi:hypothetical protein